MDAVITPRDRLSFTVFLAASLHAALILGVGFAWHVEHERSPTIEVTLAQHDDRVAPDKADFLAQSNQLGSGDAAEARETTTTEAADFHDSTVQQVASNPTPPTPGLRGFSGSEPASFPPCSSSFPLFPDSCPLFESWLWSLETPAVSFGINEKST